MKPSKSLLLVFAVLAVAWTGFLVYLTVNAADPIVVSAPQLHLASLVVAAEVKPKADGEAEAKVVKVFKDDARRAQPLPATITVRWQTDFSVPGESTYLLALTPLPSTPEKPTYEVRPVYARKSPEQPLQPRVYPYTDSVRIQVERILAK
jgi:hypothetical protein